MSGCLSGEMVLTALQHGCDLTAALECTEDTLGATTIDLWPQRVNLFCVKSRSKGEDRTWACRNQTCLGLRLQTKGFVLA